MTDDLPPSPRDLYARGLITEREYLLATGVRPDDIPAEVPR